MQMLPKSTKITGVLLFAMGIILICLGVFLHFAIPKILANFELLSDNEQHMIKIFFSGTLSSLLVGGLIALGITTIIIAIGLIKRKKWAWKALTMLTVACASINVLTIIGIPNTTSIAMIIIGGIADAAILSYLYRKRIRVSLVSVERTRITDKI